MNAITEVRNPPASPLPSTLRELHTAISVAADLSPRQRSDIARSLAALMRMAPVANLPPHPAALRPHLDRLGTITSGVGSKRAANLRAGVRAALKWLRAQADGRPYRAHQPLGRPWAALFGQLAVFSRTKIQLSRFVHWCDAAGILPTEVGTETLTIYSDHLVHVMIKGGLREQLRRVVVGWREAARHVPGWPDASLAMPERKNRITPRSAYLPAFVAEVDEHVVTITGRGAGGRAGQRFSEEPDRAEARKSRRKPVYRAATARGHAQLLYRAAALLAEAEGIPLSSVGSLADLIAPGRAQAILTTYAATVGDEAPSLHNLAGVLLEMARRRYRKDTGAHQRLYRLLQQTVRPPTELSEKNRKRLRAIGPRELRAMFDLPERLIAEACKRADEERLRLQDCIDAQIGVALAILLHQPPRIGSLAVARLGENIILPTQEGEAGAMIFSRAETKAGKKLELSLPPNVVRLICVYTDKILLHIPNRRDEHALFPGRSTTKRAHTLGLQITERIRKWVGVDVNSHLFRHLLSHLYLVRNPGKYDVVQRLLGHSSAETTKAFYCGEEGAAALAHFAACLEQVKAETRRFPNSRR
ncbi:site-specific integrase [Belnapia rosea]|uniref:site-specific integrase n=1 Tax=Belnapia rosea TaxID=938405 RepID=UPI0008848A50|nr:site-specific integrase [Belnapia rosea]SDB74877.1 Phage integrase family protein [Belnapia rosea]